tara:strand:+ start:806 stop:1402 length:597 start_codon:yes stop_codon:yes gene_type:complete
MPVIKTTNHDQKEIISDIIRLHCKDGIELDPTYSKGKFYEKSPYKQPKYKSDLYPKSNDIEKSDACCLRFDDDEISSIMFDPPFLAGYTKEKPSGVMGERFHGFRYVNDMWDWYDKCLIEFYRVLQHKGILIFKCQDTVSGGKQWWSHIHIINKAEELGFYCKDMFVLLAKSRMIGHNHSKQQHARKFHSYFLVFEKQ